MKFSPAIVAVAVILVPLCLFNQSAVSQSIDLASPWRPHRRAIRLDAPARSVFAVTIFRTNGGSCGGSALLAASLPKAV